MFLSLSNSHDWTAKKYPGWAIAIAHKATTKGKAIHQHVEVPLAFGTYGYEVYFVKPGKHFSLTRQGDGGFINWAYIGPWKRKGNTISV